MIVINLMCSLLKQNDIWNYVTASIITYGLTLYCSSAVGQEKQVVRQHQQWLEYSAQLAGSGKYSMLLDGGYRWVDNYLTGNIYYIRAGIDYAISDNANIHIGFAHVGYFFDKQLISQIEHRPYQELNFRNEVGAVSLSQRIRVEERFFEPVRSDNSRPFHWFNWRFRYQIMFNIPLIRLSKQDFDHNFSLGIGNEIFINAGNRIKHNYFDQNRILLSPTLHLGDRFSIAVTYTNQFASTLTQNQFIHSNVIWLQIRHNFRLQIQ